MTYIIRKGLHKAGPPICGVYHKDMIKTVTLAISDYFKHYESEELETLFVLDERNIIVHAHPYSCNIQYNGKNYYTLCDEVMG